MYLNQSSDPGNLHDKAYDCHRGGNASFRLQLVQTRRKTAVFFRGIPDRGNGIRLRLPDDVLQFPLPEPRWPMHLQHATEKRNRFKNSGAYRHCHGFWPGKNHFPEKPVVFESNRFVI